MKHTPEQLNIWDRFFNRYRREVMERDYEVWEKVRRNLVTGQSYSFEFQREVVLYRIVDRVTGSEEIKKEYLN